jgi:pSer/pThr/pTyr-binding forkhead associated (FHA) protein
MEVMLVMFLSDGTRRDFPIQKEMAIIGRAHGCDLRIPLSSVSRQHCELRIVDDKLVVRDLGSSNGTYHNSIRIQEATLKAGDELVIGPVVFITVVNGQPNHIDPVRTLVETKAPSRIMPAVNSESGPADSDDLDLQPVAFQDDSDKNLPEVDNESHTPTVDLDDPLAALQALTQNRNEDETESVFPLPNDEEEDKKRAPKKKK